MSIITVTNADRQQIAEDHEDLILCDHVILYFTELGEFCLSSGYGHERYNRLAYPYLYSISCPKGAEKSVPFGQLIL